MRQWVLLCLVGVQDASNDRDTHKYVPAMGGRVRAVTCWDLVGLGPLGPLVTALDRGFTRLRIGSYAEQGTLKLSNFPDICVIACLGCYCSYNPPVTCFSESSNCCRESLCCTQPVSSKETCDGILT